MAKMTDTAAEAAIGAASQGAPPADGAHRRACAWPRWPSDPGPPICGYLAEMLSAEVDERAERRRQRRVQEARFPRIKRLADFDVAASTGRTRPPSPCWPRAAYLDNG